MTSVATSVKNSALDALAITQASLHTAWPGTTGANEVTGGSPAYARQAVVINAASGGQRLLNAAVTFDVPACTVRWVGYWIGATWAFAAPNGGATPRNFMAIPASDTVYAAAHGWSDDQRVVFFNGTPPAGLTEGSIYFVRNSTTDTFKVAATAGGTAIDLTGAASFGCVVAAITEDVFAAQGFHQLTTATLAIPD